MKIEAWKAKDGSLHLTQAAQVAHDLRNDVGAMSKTIAQTIMSRAPYVEDWQATAISDVDELTTILIDALWNHSDMCRDLVDSISALRKESGQ